MARTHANRGRVLEDMIVLTNRQYRSQGRAVVHKVPTAWTPLRNGSGVIVSAKVEEKAAVDFIGTFHGRAIAFDAKLCGEDRIRWDRLEPHQAEFLSEWERDGGIGFVLVSFKLERFFLVPWMAWLGGLSASRRTLEPGPASITAARMNPEWEIPHNGRLPLDYLALVDKRYFGRSSKGVEQLA